MRLRAMQSEGGLVWTFVTSTCAAAGIHQMCAPSVLPSTQRQHRDRQPDMGLHACSLKLVPDWRDMCVSLSLCCFATS